MNYFTYYMDKLHCYIMNISVGNMRATVEEYQEIFTRIVIPAIQNCLEIIDIYRSVGENRSTIITFKGEILRTGKLVEFQFVLNHVALKNIPKSKKCAFLKVSYDGKMKDAGICYFDNIDKMIEMISFTISQLGGNIKIKQKYEGIQLEDLKKEKDKYSIIRIVIEIIILIIIVSLKM